MLLVCRSNVSFHEEKVAMVPDLQESIASTGVGCQDLLGCRNDAQLQVCFEISASLVISPFHSPILAYILWSLFQNTMFDDTGGYPTLRNHIVASPAVLHWFSTPAEPAPVIQPVLGSDGTKFADIFNIWLIKYQCWIIMLISKFQHLEIIYQRWIKYESKMIAFIIQDLSNLPKKWSKRSFQSQKGSSLPNMSKSLDEFLSTPWTVSHRS